MNISKRVMVGAILLSMLSAMMISQAFSVVTDSGNPFDVIWEAISGLDSRVETLEAQSPPQGFTSAPAYDSGWTAISERVVLNHGLGTKSLFVYMVGRTDPSLADYVHQAFYGMCDYNGEAQGARWTLLDDNRIEVLRGPQDTYWHEFRVYIWILP
jgi:hypothetical protein